MNIGKFYEEPKIYLIALLISALLYLFPFYRVAGTVLFMLTATGGIAYILGLTFPELRARLLINTKKGNTFQNIIIALVAQAILVGVTIFISGFIAGGSIVDIGHFLTIDRAAVTGAATSPFENNPIINWVVFVFMFGLVETLVAVRFYDIILSTSKSNYTVKDPKVWIGAAVIGVAAIYYHIYAKSTLTGIPNPLVLSIMFILFFSFCILSVITKESSSSIYMHWLNNGLSML